MWEGGEQAAAHGDWVRRGQVTELGAAVGTSLRKQHASSGQVAGWAGRLETERCPCCGSPAPDPRHPPGPAPHFSFTQRKRGSHRPAEWDSPMGSSKPGSEGRFPLRPPGAPPPLSPDTAHGRDLTICPGSPCGRSRFFLSL